MAVPFYPGLASCLWKPRPASAPSRPTTKKPFISRAASACCFAAPPRWSPTCGRPGRGTPATASLLPPLAGAAPPAPQRGRHAPPSGPVGPAHHRRGDGGAPRAAVEARSGSIFFRLGQHPSSAPLKPYPHQKPLLTWGCATPRTEQRLPMCKRIHPMGTSGRRIIMDHECLCPRAAWTTLE